MTNHTGFTIECSHVSKSYGEIRALKDVSVSFVGGEMVGILGANGAGKSTLISLLSGSAKPSKGELWWVDASQQKKALQREQVGLVAHSTLLYGDLTARENLELYAKLYRVKASRVDEVVVRCGLQKYADRPTRTYSRGMAQRTAIARAILHQPPLLLCDEPYTGLDPAGAAFLGALLQEMKQQGTAIILVTHDLDIAAELSERVLVMSDGRIPIDKKAIPETPFTSSMLNSLLATNSTQR
jgi:heme exporter protein A